MKLCITENRLKSIKQIEGLPPTLADLYISPNPVSELPHFRLQVLRRQPQLRLLDDLAATPQEKVKANVAYGDDVGLFRDDLFREDREGADDLRFHEDVQQV